ERLDAFPAAHFDDRAPAPLQGFFQKGRQHLFQGPRLQVIEQEIGHRRLVIGTEGSAASWAFPAARSTQSRSFALAAIGLEGGSDAGAETESWIDSHSICNVSSLPRRSPSSSPGASSSG